MDCIHGTFEDDGSNTAGWYRESAKRLGTESRAHLRSELLNPFGPMLPRSNPSTSSPNQEGRPFSRSFSQSIMTKTIRKPDGTMETTRTVQDSMGNRTTSVTRSKDGKTETVTSYNDQPQEEIPGKRSNNIPALKEHTSQNHLSQRERNIYVSKEGYALPRNFY